MTKHTYQDAKLTGTAILGQYKEGDIREALRQFRDPFEMVREDPNKWFFYGDSIMHKEEIPIGISVSYRGSHTQPEHILVSTLGFTPFVEKESLKGYLEELLDATGITELDTKREQFEENPFKGWEFISKEILI